MDNTAHTRRGLTTTVGLLIALSLMGGGWIYFAKSQEVTVALSCRFVDLSPGFIVVGEPPKIEVLVKGPARLVRNLKIPLTHDIHIGGMKPGRHVATLSPKDITVPQGAAVLTLTPSFFTFDIHIRKEKSVPVVPDFLNTPVSGYILSGVDVSPHTVHIAGPADSIHTITEVRTTPVDLSGIRESTKKTVALNLSDTHSVVSEKDRLVQLVIHVKEEVIEETVSLPVQCLTDGLSCVTRPDRIHVWIKGPKNTVDKVLQGSDIPVSIDLKGLGPGLYQRPAVISPPLDTTITKTEPTVFTAEVLETGRQKKISGAHGSGPETHEQTDKEQ